MQKNIKTPCILLKKFILAVVLICLANLSPGFCQVKTSNASPGKSPVISFMETTRDFGTIKPGEEAVHFFVFSNDGESPLVIQNVKTTCGCTVQSWPKKLILPGSRDSIRVEYDTRIKGVFSKTITVHSNASTPLVDLRISGNVSRKKK